MKHLLPDLFYGLHVSELKCDTCILTKIHRVSYPSSSNKSGTPFALIHSDVWGPSPISTLSGFRWFVTFVDDCTHMTWLYVMKHKHDVFGIFRMFHTLVKTQFSAKIQFSDLTMEENMSITNLIITSNPMELYMKLHVLKHHNKMVSPKGKIGIF